MEGDLEQELPRADARALGVACAASVCLCELVVDAPRRLRALSGDVHCAQNARVSERLELLPAATPSRNMAFYRHSFFALLLSVENSGPATGRVPCARANDSSSRAFAVEEWWPWLCFLRLWVLRGEFFALSLAFGVSPPRRSREHIQIIIQEVLPFSQRLFGFPTSAD